jgi:hypothetical protein
METSSVFKSTTFNEVLITFSISEDQSSSGTRFMLTNSISTGAVSTISASFVPVPSPFQVIFSG